MRNPKVRPGALNIARAMGSSVAAIAAVTGAAQAGGFEVHEQSAYYQGMSFAGSAAGRNLSSMFWNPAAAGNVDQGLTFASSYSLIIPDSTITATGGTALNLGARSVEIGRDAVVPASYAAWRGEIDPNLIFAISINSQFGLGTKPDNLNWAGQFHQRSAKLMSVNVSPTVAYKIMPNVTVAAGMQFQNLDLKHFKANAGPLPNGNSNSLEGSDLGHGFTLGATWTPTSGTTLGVGYRSQIDHELSGKLVAEGTPVTAGIKADVTTPDKITASLEQVITPKARLNATVEWTNWSELGVVPIKNTSAIPVVANNLVVFIPVNTTISNLDFRWHDGWFFAAGGEYDYSDKLTLRAGGAYEISPIQNASERLLQVPDADRIWASLGATYKWSESLSLDFAYSHVFVEDSNFSRVPAAVSASSLTLSGNVESSVDILSVGLTSKW